jgi:SAM-dependent methyltransferase
VTTSLAPKAGEFRLAAHDVSMAQLRSVMQRTGSELEPLEFIEAVSLAFQEVQSCRERKNTEQGFRADPSFLLFERALRFAWESATPRSILVLGCARGFAGKTAEFARTTIEEICQPAASRKIDFLDLSPGDLRSHGGGTSTSQASRYDLVVSHSLLHFVPDVSPFFRLVRSVLHSGGGLILSHEPNARFWRNADCMAALAELRDVRLRRWKRIPRPAAVLARFRRPAAVPQTSFFDEVNKMLAQYHGFKSALAENEIRRLVDVHRPEATPGDFRIGCDGFDMDEIIPTYLPGFRSSWTATCNHLGYYSHESLSSGWRQREAALAGQHPQDGSVVTAYLREEATS